MKNLIKKVFWKIIFSIRRLTNSIRESKEWKDRISTVLSSRDNHFIARAPKAGAVEGDIQWMHNGLKIYKGSYYGKNIMTLLIKNKGVHEPQEERVFQEVLKDLQNKPEPIMVELGAYWAFYSLWFLTECKNGKAFLVEPSIENLNYGKSNFELNNAKGDFLNGFIGAESDSTTFPPTYTINDLITIWNLDYIDILHSDIQGYELDMLKGIDEKFLQERVRYIFISTHTNEIHDQCVNFLLNKNFIIIANANLYESYSYDGLIVCRNIAVEGISKVDITLREIKKNHI